MRRTPATLLVFSFPIALFGCRDEPKANKAPLGVVCSGICALKIDTSPDHPAMGGPVHLADVVVTTPTVALSGGALGFYVQTQTPNDPLSGRYSGVLISIAAGQHGPKLGDLVTVDGTYQETDNPTGKSRWVQASSVNDGGKPGVIHPAVIDTAEKVATGGQDADAYEGALLRVDEVAITDMPSASTFQVENALLIGSDFYRYGQPALGLQFSLISGVLRLAPTGTSMMEYQLAPRFGADLVTKAEAAFVRTIRDIQDPDSPGAPQETCRNDTGSATIGKCASVSLSHVVVTAVGGYVSKNLRAVFVQDPSSTDGRFAGIKIVYKKDGVAYVPAVGDFIDVQGQSITFRGGMQIQNPLMTQNGSDSMIIPPFVVQPTDITRRDVATHAFEGTLVKLVMPTVDKACIEDTSARDQGGWTLVGDVEMGTDFIYTYNGGFRDSTIQCVDAAGEPTGACGCAQHTRPNDMRMAGQVFQSITGIVDFAFGDFMLNPRDDTDLVQN